MSRAERILDEPFEYELGPLVEVTEGRWLTQSGTAGQVQVSDSAVLLTQGKSEDVRVMLTGGPFTVAEGAVLYLACTVRFTELPSGGGSYFIHFKDGGTGFRGRVFATVQDAASGSFRVGVSEASNNPTLLAQDLQLDTLYRMVCRYEVGTAGATLWVDPTTESDPSVTAADDGTAIPIHGLALRQSLSGGNGMGTLVLDDLRVASTFDELFGSDDPAPRIEQHPRDQSAVAGETVTFTVRATGAPPLVFQWLHDGIPMPDAVTAELTLSTVTASDAGTYEVIVSNDAGVVTSTAALLAVQESPVPGIGSIAWAAADGWLTCRWLGQPGQKYTVQGAASPEGPWEVLATDLETTEYTEPMDQAPGARYYRVQAF